MADQELTQAARAARPLSRQEAHPRRRGIVHRWAPGGDADRNPGSSDVFERGFITYSNEAKRAMLGVTPMTLAKHGAVSRETAEAMATGVLAHAPVDLAVSITGIAGPGGAVPGKPVGLVYLAAASRSGRLIQHERKY